MSFMVQKLLSFNRRYIYIYIYIYIPTTCIILSLLLQKIKSALKIENMYLKVAVENSVAIPVFIFGL